MMRTMSLLDKLHTIRWNIGFVELSMEDIVTSCDGKVDVKWVKHNFTKRFFADPFILSVRDGVIKVLVEEYFYEKKRGVISLLNISRENFELIDKKILLEQPFHQSYPFILRHNGGVYILPEASESGNLYIYDFDEEKEVISNQRVLIPEPLLDSTIFEIDGKWYLLCTKRGDGKYSDLYVYESDSPIGGYKVTNGGKPVISDMDLSRPAGKMLKVGGELFRVSQVCSNFYGEYMKLLKLKSVSPFEQVFVKDIKCEESEFSRAFHTINGFGDITVVDGNKRTFRPCFQISHALKYVLFYKNK